VDANPTLDEYDEDGLTENYLRLVMTNMVTMAKDEAKEMTKKTDALFLKYFTVDAAAMRENRVLEWSSYGDPIQADDVTIDAINEKERLEGRYVYRPKVLANDLPAPPPKHAVPIFPAKFAMAYDNGTTLVSVVKLNGRQLNTVVVEGKKIRLDPSPSSPDAANDEEVMAENNPNVSLCVL
jgi:hypothetical protein